MGYGDSWCLHQQFIMDFPLSPAQNFSWRSWLTLRANPARLLAWRPCLRTQLLALAAVVLLPMLGLQWRQALGDMRMAREQAQTRVQSQADHLASQLSATFERARLMLEFLGQRSELAGLDSQNCNRLLESMASLDPLWTNLGLIGVDGVPICASVRPESAVNLNFRSRLWMQQGLSTPEFRVHEVRRSQLLSRMVFITTLPHRNHQGLVDGLLMLSIDADALARQWAALHLPPGSQVELRNAAGLQMSQRFGTVEPQALALSARAGLGRSSTHSDWQMVVIQPLEPLLAAHWAALREDLLSLLLCGLLAVASALVLSRRISTPLRCLTAAAAAVARGERGVRMPVLRGEMAALAKQFNHMQAERERSEDELRRSLQHFELAAASGNVWFWDIEQGGGSLLGGAGSTRGLCLGQTEMSLSAWQELILPADRPLLREALVGHLRDRKPYQLELRAHGAGGSERRLQLRGQAVWNEAGRAVRMAGTVFDVTERHQLEEARRQRAVAESASAAKSAFVARMSHELRTPMNAVLGFAQLLEDDAKEPLSPVQRRRLQHISEGGRHLLALMDDMLDTARIELGQLKVTLKPVPLAPLVSEVLALQQESAARQRVTLPIGVSAGVLQVNLDVRADPLRLRQVLLNLVSNAIKYNRSGGAVRIAAWRETGQVWLAIEDDGSGFTPEQLAQLFQPYNRLGREHSSVPGVGIGLALTRQLLQLMGGSIEIGNGPGGGCRVLLGLQTA